MPVLRESDPRALPLTVDTFREGGVFVYPTSTVYGLGGKPLSASVHRRIHQIKGSTEGKPHLVLTDDWSRVVDWIVADDPLNSRLMQVGRRLSITILFPAGPAAPEHLIGAGGRVAIRMTRHPFCTAVIQEVRSVLVSTSANPTGRPAPARFTDIDDSVLSAADLAVDGGNLPGHPSTIVAVNKDRLDIVREGSVARSVILSELDQL